MKSKVAVKQEPKGYLHMSSGLSKGDWFVMDGNLFLSTTDGPKPDYFVPGTGFSSTMNGDHPVEIVDVTIQVHRRSQP